MNSRGRKPAVSSLNCLPAFRARRIQRTAEVLAAADAQRTLAGVKRRSYSGSTTLAPIRACGHRIFPNRDVRSLTLGDKRPPKVLVVNVSWAPTLSSGAEGKLDEVDLLFLGSFAPRCPLAGLVLFAEVS